MPDPSRATDGRSLGEHAAEVLPDLDRLAGYGLVRLGQEEKFTADALPSLLRSFPQLPDLYILAGLCAPDADRRGEHFEKALGFGSPLFAQGLRALAAYFPQRPDPLAEPLASLLPGSLWSAWIARSPW